MLRDSVGPMISDRTRWRFLIDAMRTALPSQHTGVPAPLFFRQPQAYHCERPARVIASHGSWRYAARLSGCERLRFATGHLAGQLLAGLRRK